MSLQKRLIEKDLKIIENAQKERDKLWNRWRKISLLRIGTYFRLYYQMEYHNSVIERLMEEFIQGKHLGKINSED